MTGRTLTRVTETEGSDGLLNCLLNTHFFPRWQRQIRELNNRRRNHLVFVPNVQIEVKKKCSLFKNFKRKKNLRKKNLRMVRYILFFIVKNNCVFGKFFWSI